MPIHNFKPLRGEISILTIQSQALEGNMLGDPAARRVAVYLPPVQRAGETFPLLVDLVGYTGSGFSHLNFKPFAETVPQRIERLVDAGEMGPVVVAFPDCFTSLGGNQYINSLSVGNWADFLIEEMLPELERRYPIKSGREHRAVFGKSSGGYGSLAHAMHHAHAWNAAACHSGDIGFDLLFRDYFPKLLNRLDDAGGIGPFLEEFEAARKLKEEDIFHLMILASAASYDPDPKALKGIRLPVDPVTCALDEERWQAWLAHDPLTLVRQETCLANLKSLAGLYIDCGNRDQYHLVYGARRFRDQLEQAGVPHFYEEFEDNHSDIDYRMDRSLPYLFRALTEGR